MQEAFLIIISLLGAAYAFWTKQPKTALGLLILAAGFVFFIPNLAVGIVSDIYGALSLVIYLAGVIVIVWQKKILNFEDKQDHEEKTE